MAMATETFSDNSSLKHVERCESVVVPWRT